ncbi:uncharacterized protein Dana_GF16291 [Drosophila ananassae]|uniref:Gustatory receptor n=1 Tax=Drosophila ananassae TaxID=7217 RepID=B3LXJ7_DROAN|nr:putative gustatory receptor 98b [Drosophila ananassae]EDV43891.1 uncharacterized protein Dana_GF16291 [Drosophila ananassae]
MAVRRKNRLLATALPYLQVFSVFVSFERTLDQRFRKYLMSAYVAYAIAILLVVFYESYENILSINLEVVEYNLEDFTKVMGNIQKALLSVVALCNHLNMLFNYRRLGGIYEEIANLETEIEDASQYFGGQKHRTSFRMRLNIKIGLGLVVIMVVLPRCTYESMGPFLTSTNKTVTEFILVMQQFKALEYCVFVMLVHELLLLLRHTLQQLQLELVDCQDRDMLQALCVALKRNQRLVGQIWRLVNELGSYFSLPMIMLFLYNCVTILHMINWAYINTFIENDCCEFERFWVCLLLLLNLLYTCYLSQRCTDTYNSFPRILHQIRCNSINFSTLTMGLKEYLLQMQHLKIFFSCGGFFNINLKYCGGVVITLMGYIIILLQFKMQAIAQKKYSAALS